jgi:hypothetical protein
MHFDFTPAARKSRFRLPLDLIAQAFFLRPQLRRELGAEVFRFEDLADLDLRFGSRRVGATLDPIDRLLLRLALPDPEAGDQLLRLGKRTVGDDSLGCPRTSRAHPSSSACSPFAASMMPAFTSSSLNLPMSARSCWLGSTPASVFLSALIRS